MATCSVSVLSLALSLHCCRSCRRQGRSVSEGALAAFSLQAPFLPLFASLSRHGCCPLAHPQHLSVLFDCVCMLAVRAALSQNWPPEPGGLPSPHRVSPLCEGWFASVSATGLAEIRQGVSPLRLFLVVCPHGLLCLDTLTTRSCEVTTFQPAASLSESKLFSCSLCLCRFETQLQAGHVAFFILLNGYAPMV